MKTCCRMVSTNNITYSEQIYKLFRRNHSTLFLIMKRSTDAQCWTATLSNWKKQAPEVFYENTVFRNFAIFIGKHLCEIFKNIYSEEHPRQAAFELTLSSDYWEICFWITFKTILIHLYYKNTSHFQTKALNKI